MRSREIVEDQRVREEAALHPVTVRRMTPEELAKARGRAAVRPR